MADRAPAPPWTLPPAPNECLSSDERRSFGAGWATRGQVTAQRRSRSFRAAAGALPLRTCPHRIVSASSVLAWPERCWGASPMCSHPTDRHLVPVWVLLAAGPTSLVCCQMSTHGHCAPREAKGCPCPLPTREEIQALTRKCQDLQAAKEAEEDDPTEGTPEVRPLREAFSSHVSPKLSLRGEDVARGGFSGVSCRQCVWAPKCPSHSLTVTAATLASPPKLG